MGPNGTENTDQPVQVHGQSREVNNEDQIVCRGARELQELRERSGP